MSAADFSDLITKLTGQVPEGLEWLSWLFSYLFLSFSLFIVLEIIKIAFSYFNKK